MEKEGVGGLPQVRTFKCDLKVADGRYSLLPTERTLAGLVNSAWKKIPPISAAQVTERKERNDEKTYDCLLGRRCERELHMATGLFLFAWLAGPHPKPAGTPARGGPGSAAVWLDVR
jgi:hypothetical protein